MSERKDKLLRLVQAAKAAGCPRDQIQRFVNDAYAPYPWQLRFHAAAREADHPGGPVDIGAGGARGPGKSHVVLSQAALDDCQRFDGLKGLFLRQTGVSAQESFDDLINKTVRGRVEYRKTKNSLVFENGSRILLGGFKDEGDIDKYIGIEYDFIIVEELNQLTDEKYTKLRGSLRTSKVGWRPRMYTSFNPGGTGHVFVRERYVIPYRLGKEKDTRFIPSTYKENPALNPEYISYLESLGGALGKAWREGEWDSFAGQYFYEWNYDAHVVDGAKMFPYGIPTQWPKFRSMDPSGRTGTTACHWYALDSQGDVWIYKEYYKDGLDHDEHAKNIRKMSEDEDNVSDNYNYSVIDGAAFAKAGYSETVAEIYERHGVIGLVAAAKERVVGWNAVHTYLRHSEKMPPKLHIFDTCRAMIKTIPLAQHDTLHPDDVSTKQGMKGIEVDGEIVGATDHWDCLDDLRYFLRTLKEQKAPKAETLIEKRLRQLKERTQG